MYILYYSYVYFMSWYLLKQKNIIRDIYYDAEKTKWALTEKIQRLLGFSL